MKIRIFLVAIAVILLSNLSPAMAGPDDTVKIGVVGFYDNLDPTEGYNGWAVTRYGVGETLVHFDEIMNLEPWLAEGWTLSDDKLTWTFKIRGNVKFSNGKPMTADAVKKSLERSFAKSQRASAGFFEYESMTVDGDSLAIKTKNPTPSLPGCLADPLFLIVDVDADKGDAFATKGPIGTGPYSIKSFSRGLTVVERNPYYWDGEVPFKEVTIQTIDDTNTRTMALQSGEIGFAVNVAASDVSLFRGKPDFTVEEVASLRTVFSFMNQHGPLADIKLRQAVIRALNREAYAKSLLHDTFTPGKAPVPPSLDYGFNQLKDPNAFDVNGAKALLAEAGYRDTDGDGYVEKDGKKITLQHIIYNSRAELPILAEASQADLKAVGIDVEVQSYDYTSLLEIQAEGKYDLLIWNVITANTGDPEHYLRELWKTYSEQTKNTNTAGYSNPQVDSLMDKLAVEFDVSVRRQLMIDIQQLIMNDAASVFFAYPETNIIFNNKMLKGVRMLPSDYYWLTKDVAPV